MNRIGTAALLAWCALGSVVAAQELSEEQQAAAMAFAMHDAVYSTYHEIGHLLANELELPILGKEEDAADALAVVMMLSDPDDQEEANTALVDAADGWYASAIDTTGAGVEDFAYFDVHSLDIQRAYAMVCIMVGKDPEWFSDAADEYNLDQDQRDSCSGLYEGAERSWTTLLEPHLLKEGEQSKIDVIYEDPGEYAIYRDELESRQVLEKAAARIRDTYALPYAITFRAKQCGEANAFYSYGESELTYCYEMADEMVRRYVEIYALTPEEEAALMEEAEAEAAQDAADAPEEEAGEDASEAEE